MPAWNAREGELKTKTEEQWKRASEVERNGGPPVVQASYIVLLDALERHVDRRDRDLDEALDILTGPSSSATGKSQREEWSDHLREKGAKAFEAIADVADDDEEWSFFRTWVGSIAAQEGAFYKLLAQAPLARVQGRILEYTRAFEEEKGKLLDKWEALQDRDESVDEKMERVTDELREVFERALKRVSERNVTAGRKLHDFVEGASFVDQGTAPESPSLIQELVERPLDAIEHWSPTPRRWPTGTGRCTGPRRPRSSSSARPAPAYGSSWRPPTSTWRRRSSRTPGRPASTWPRSASPGPSRTMPGPSWRRRPGSSRRRWRTSRTPTRTSSMNSGASSSGRWGTARWRTFWRPGGGTPSRVSGGA